MKLILGLLLLAAPAASYQFTKRVNQDKLASELTAAGVAWSSISCGEADRCEIAASSGDPAPVVSAHIASDPRAERQALLDELEAIEDAIDAGTETAVQRRRFMKILLKLNGLSKRP